jgi:glycosyl transferase family 25
MKSHAVQVISVVDAFERRQTFAKNNAHLDFEFVEAVNGRPLDFDKIPMPDVFDPQLKYTKGAIGCALSHIGLWRRAANEEYPLTIAEDDAIFRHDFGG